MNEPSFKKLGIKALFLVWGAPHGSHRTDLIAHHLDMDVKNIYITTKQGKYYAPFKYIYQLFATLVFLARNHYHLVFIQDPPIFAVLPVYFFSFISPIRFVIDAHTPPLLSPIWAWTLPLHRFLSRKAITTLVTNDFLQQLVAGWNAHAFVLEDPPIEVEGYQQTPLEKSDLNIVMVSSASPDEPVGEVLQAARDLPEMQFFITGDYAGRYPHIIEDAPLNAHFTGYLREGFMPLLKAADVIIDLCVEDYQFLSGANEALWLGKPLITSKSPVLENYFSKGTIHVDNTVKEIRQGLLILQSRLAEFQGDMCVLQTIRGREWWQKANELLDLIQQEMHISVQRAPDA